MDDLLLLFAPLKTLTVNWEPAEWAKWGVLQRKIDVGVVFLLFVVLWLSPPPPPRPKL